MNKILKVVKPFFVMEEGDTFELAENGREYNSSVSAEHHESNDDNGEVTARYNASYTISTDYAETLEQEGYLKAVEPEKTSNFVNVFDEIKELVDGYKHELSTLDDDMADMPQCLKVERQTVLTNLVTVLEYLNSLKK